MGIIGLNVPTEVKWERMCVSPDMIDQGTCDKDFPSKWSSSLALFRYIPEEEYQVYPGRKIVYLKLVCTITGYQAKSDEIEGELDYDGMSTTILDALDEALESYFPCNGAIIQVTVGPKKGVTLPINQYPYFMDFQPKKRDLFELASDTQERLTRTLESVNLRKASGTTQSNEVLDIDQGGSVGISIPVSPNVAVGVNASSSQQKGTKDVSNEESSVLRTTDESRERRETESHTAQISQLYSLFNSYHLGTNRAIFFIGPRPHIIEKPTGFVRGPREVEGIQEIFLVVNKPDDENELCVSVRLDTSHLIVFDVPVKYDTSKSDEYFSENIVRPPTKKETESGINTIEQVEGFYRNTVLSKVSEFTEQKYDWTAEGLVIGTYECFQTRVVQEETYTSNLDFKINVSLKGGYEDLADSPIHENAFSNITVSQDGERLTVRTEATSQTCYLKSTTPPNYEYLFKKEVKTFWGKARRHLRIFLISREPTETEKSYSAIITTRGLCCCPEFVPDAHSPKDDIVDIRDLGGMSSQMIDPEFFVNNALSSSDVKDTAIKSFKRIDPVGTTDEVDEIEGTDQILKDSSKLRYLNALRSQGMMTIREANALGDKIQKSMFRSVVSSTRKKRERKTMIDTEILPQILVNELNKSEYGRGFLRSTTEENLPSHISDKLSKYFRKSTKDITRRELASLRSRELVRITGLNENEIIRLKLSILGIPTKEKNEHQPN